MGDGAGRYGLKMLQENGWCCSISAHDPLHTEILHSALKLCIKPSRAGSSRLDRGRMPHLCASCLQEYRRHCRRVVVDLRLRSHSPDLKDRSRQFGRLSLHRNIQPKPRQSTSNNTTRKIQKLFPTLARTHTHYLYLPIV